MFDLTPRSETDYEIAVRRLRDLGILPRPPAALTGSRPGLPARHASLATALRMLAVAMAHAANKGAMSS